MRVATGHTTGGWEEKSDQVTAIPLVERDGSRRQGRKESGKITASHWSRGREQERRGGQQQRRLVLGSGAGRSGRSLLRSGTRRRRAAGHLHPRAATANAGLPGRGGGERKTLRPHQQEAQYDCRRRFHYFNLGLESRLRKFAWNYFAGCFSAASIFFRYLAESFWKSFRQPLQHSLISRVPFVNT